MAPMKRNIFDNSNSESVTESERRRFILRDILIDDSRRRKDILRNSSVDIDNFYIGRHLETVGGDLERFKKQYKFDINFRGQVRKVQGFLEMALCELEPDSIYDRSAYCGVGVLYSDVAQKLMGGDSIASSYEMIFCYRTFSYISGDGILRFTRFNDLGLPFHPLESEVLDIIDGYITGPKLYPSKHQLGPFNFYQHNYAPFISAGVIYQDYLRHIDKTLFVALKNACSQSGSPFIVPPKNDRMRKLRQQIPDVSESKRKSFMRAAVLLAR